jgi:hypothetical protein
MTTHIGKRCGHCGQAYSFQGSGDGCQRPENDATYCPGCKVVRDAALREAFSKVPRIYEARSRDIKELGDRFKDVTLEKLLAWEAEDERIKQSSDSSWVRNVRRVFVPLFNIQTGDSTTTRDIRGRSEGNPAFDPIKMRYPEYVGVTFRLTTWRVSPEWTAEVQMEWDLREGRFTDRIWR